jgi:hypothetical protein
MLMPLTMKFKQSLVLVVVTIVILPKVVRITAAKVTTNILATTKSHLVFMLVDDWGWADIGYTGRDPPTKEIVTPNIDSLVKEGLELDQHYALIQVLLTITFMSHEWNSKTSNLCQFPKINAINVYYAKSGRIILPVWVFREMNSLVPRPLPLLQCYTQKRGRAWEIMSRA